MPLRRHLVILAALTILPLLLFSAWIVLRAPPRGARPRRAVADRHRPRALARARPRDHRHRCRRSSRWRPPRPRAEATCAPSMTRRVAAAPAEGWTTVILADPAGAPRLLTAASARHPRAAAVRRPGGLAAVVTSTLTPVVSDGLRAPGDPTPAPGHRHPGARRPAGAGSVHPLRGDRDRVAPRHPAAASGCPPSGSARCSTRKRMIIARTRGEEQFVGQPASRAPARGERPVGRGLVPRPHQGRHATPTRPSAARPSPASRWRSACPPSRSTRRCAARCGASPAPASSSSALGVVHRRLLRAAASRGPITALAVAAPASIGRGAEPPATATAITEVNALRPGDAGGRAARCATSARRWRRSTGPDRCSPASSASSASSRA